MRSLLPRCSLGLAAAQAVPRAAYALCLHMPHRCIFVRELSTPATLECSKSGVAPFPARLLWQFSSKRPRHLVLCVREPLPTACPPAAKDAFGDLGGAEATEASVVRTVVADDAPCASEDFMYGRLFLRPYNVAQLLTVLQGWSDSPATVNRPRSSLTLTAVLPPSASAKPIKSSNVDERPMEVLLTARLTRKTVPAALGHSGGAAVAEAATYLSTDADPIADEDYPDTVYVDGDMCTLNVVLRDSDLVLLTTHLESVLSDLFAIEHCNRKMERRKAFNSQHSNASYRTRRVPSSLKRSSARQPQYLSQQYVPAARTRSNRMEHRYQSRLPQHSSHSGSRRHSVATAAASSAVTGAEEGGAVEGESNPFAEAPAKPAPAMTATEAEEDDYEIVEDVEEFEGGEDDDKAAAATADAATSSTPTVAPSGSEASPTSYITTHTRERGEMTMESADRYAETRFVRDGSVAASEVQEVGRAGDFDVLRRTRRVQGSTEKGGSRTTVHATETTGAFRSSSGEVTGSFSYEQFATTTETTSAKAAAAAAAATTIPLHRETADGDCEGGVKMEVTATKSQPSTELHSNKAGEDSPCEQQQEGATGEAVKPTRKRQASGTAAAASKKKAKKKSRKTPTKRKSAASTSVSVSAS